MCDPSKLAAMDLAGTGLKAGTYWQQARYEEALARQNEILLNRQISATGEAGTAAYNAAVERGRQVAGTQRAIMGASGVDPNIDQALSLLEDTAGTSREDAATSMNEAVRGQHALKVQKSAVVAAGKNARKYAPLNFGTTVLTGGARAYGIYKGWDR